MKNDYIVYIVACTVYMAQPKEAGKIFFYRGGIFSKFKSHSHYSIFEIEHIMNYFVYQPCRGLRQIKEAGKKYYPRWNL
jgi:hypothetical protein